MSERSAKKVFYSVLIAINALSFIARFAGRYPAITPTAVEKATPPKASQMGIADCMVLPCRCATKLTRNEAP